MDKTSDTNWNWEFYEELVEDVNENKNIIQVQEPLMAAA